MAPRPAVAIKRCIPVRRRTRLDLCVACEFGRRVLVKRSRRVVAARRAGRRLLSGVDGSAVGRRRARAQTVVERSIAAHRAVRTRRALPSQPRPPAQPTGLNQVWVVMARSLFTARELQLDGALLVRWCCGRLESASWW